MDAHGHQRLAPFIQATARLWFAWSFLPVEAAIR